MLSRRRLLMAAAISPVAAIVPHTAMAAQPEIFAINGIAIHGIDPVAYFTQGAPVRGHADHALTWRGATWLFASMANMEAFMANPEAYCPKYGGYCAYAVARDYLANTVPEAWTIFDGALYLNYSVNVRQLWLEDPVGNIALADGHWPEILG